MRPQICILPISPQILSAFFIRILPVGVSADPQVRIIPQANTHRRTLYEHTGIEYQTFNHGVDKNCIVCKRSKIIAVYRVYEQVIFTVTYGKTSRRDNNIFSKTSKTLLNNLLLNCTQRNKNIPNIPVNK